jgi:phage-related protein
VKTKKEDNTKKNIKPTEAQQTTEPKKRGRQPGVSLGERQKGYIQISDTMRIDISDGLNHTVQKYTIKTRMNDGESEDGTEKWKAGDTYEEWTNTAKCYCSSFKSALKRIFDLMLEDGVKEKEMMWLDEYMKLHAKTDAFLRKFENTYDEEQTKSKGV